VLKLLSFNVAEDQDVTDFVNALKLATLRAKVLYSGLGAQPLCCPGVSYDWLVWFLLLGLVQWRRICSSQGQHIL
jgi:hypothetical protein